MTRWIHSTIALGVVVLFGLGQEPSREHQHESSRARSVASEKKAVKIHYLEIVTPDVDGTCKSLEKQHSVTFGQPVPELGNARTAALDGGGSIGVRAPMRDDEDPVVRPYLLVEDIDAAVDAAKEAGGQIAMPPTEIPGRGKFAITLQGGIQHGLWQL